MEGGFERGFDGGHGCERGYVGSTLRMLEKSIDVEPAVVQDPACRQHRSSTMHGDSSEASSAVECQSWGESSPELARLWLRVNNRATWIYDGPSSSRENTTQLW